MSGAVRLRRVYTTIVASKDSEHWGFAQGPQTLHCTLPF